MITFSSCVSIRIVPDVCSRNAPKAPFPGSEAAILWITWYGPSSGQEPFMIIALSVYMVP